MRCEKRKFEDRLTCTGWSHTEGMETTEAWRFLIKGSNSLSSSHLPLPLGLRRTGSALIQALMPVNQKSPACRLLVSTCCHLVSGQGKRKVNMHSLIVSQSFPTLSNFVLLFQTVTSAVYQLHAYWSHYCRVILGVKMISILCTLHKRNERKKRGA